MPFRDAGYASSDSRFCGWAQWNLRETDLRDLAVSARYRVGLEIVVGAGGKTSTPDSHRHKDVGAVKSQLPILCL